MEHQPGARLPQRAERGRQLVDSRLAWPWVGDAALAAPVDLVAHRVPRFSRAAARGRRSSGESNPPATAAAIPLWCLHADCHGGHRHRPRPVRRAASRAQPEQPGACPGHAGRAVWRHGRHPARDRRPARRPPSSSAASLGLATPSPRRPAGHADIASSPSSPPARRRSRSPRPTCSIEGVYAVPDQSPLTTPGEVDRLWRPIGVKRGLRVRPLSDPDPAPLERHGGPAATKGPWCSSPSTWRRPHGRPGADDQSSSRRTPAVEAHRGPLHGDPAGGGHREEQARGKHPLPA